MAITTTVRWALERLSVSLRRAAHDQFEQPRRRGEEAAEAVPAARKQRHCTRLRSATEPKAESASECSRFDVPRALQSLQANCTKCRGGALNVWHWHARKRVLWDNGRGRVVAAPTRARAQSCTQCPRNHARHAHAQLQSVRRQFCAAVPGHPHDDGGLGGARGARHDAVKQHADDADRAARPELTAR
eukprot:6186897-Pleurochrysis_carterae.AAC.2